MRNLFYVLRVHKNIKAFYYLKVYSRFFEPRFLFRCALSRWLNRYEKSIDKQELERRLAYYHKRTKQTTLPQDSPRVGDLKLQKRMPKTYFFDTMEYARYFFSDLRLQTLFGDITYVPELPSIVKSRPIEGDNQNSVLLNLDKQRHFVFLNDPFSFREKEDRVVFRGKIVGKESRERFMEMYFGHPMCDLADVSRHGSSRPEWQQGKMTLVDHLRFKFIMALEGNDVASNLKWVMSSNSIAVMPKPTYETWFMEGQLEPNVHYIEIKPDFSDLEERLNYYIAHPEEAERIIEHAHHYVRQFQNPRREKLLSILVLDRYFKMTGQR